MMKKFLLLLAAATLLVSCTKTIDIVDEEKERGKDPTQSTTEITLQTIANPTRAIAEGTEVPKDNFIGFMPNFQSDIAGTNFDEYNQIRRFGYDRSIGAWRGVVEGVYEDSEDHGLLKGLLDDYQRMYFVINPFYWPGGDRVIMDYVSYSYNNILDVLLSTLKNGYGLGAMLTTENQMYIDMVLAAIPQKYNANRMDLWYQNKVLNVLGYALAASFVASDSFILHPYSVGVVLVLSALIDDIETLGMEGSINPDDIDAVLELLLAKGSEDDILEMLKDSEVFRKVRGSYEFIVDYYEAYQILTHKTTLSNSDLTEERYTEVVNQAYWFFMNNLSKVSKYIQDDLMYAYDRNLKNTNGGTIQAKYNHAKAWVKVVVNNTSVNKDLLVSGIAFENVKTGGSLVIDNSKTSFETYWDFDATQPEHGTSGSGSSGLVFDPYKIGTLNGEAVSVSNNTNSVALTGTKAGMKKPNIQREYNELMADMAEVLVRDTVFIPDAYFVPHGCYGPALSITRGGGSNVPAAVAESATTDTAAVEEVVPAPEVAGGGYLDFKFLRNDNPFETRVADNLGGAMFPAQEPGKINIAYYSWERVYVDGVGDNGHEIEYGYNMAELLENLTANSGKVTLHQATLNLPRKNWQMGKVYIYLISIADNEIVIDACIEKDWGVDYVTPAYGPDVPGIVPMSPDFIDDPDWGWN